MNNKEIDSAIHTFDKYENLETFPPDTTLFDAGEPRKYMYVVVDGEVDLYVGGFHVETVQQGGIFGEMALIEEDVRIGTAITRTECKLALLDEKRFNFLIQQTPYFALKVMRILANRLRRMDLRIQK